MLRFVRAGLAAAFLALVLSPATAAEKLFKQSSLDEAAIKLEAQIKSDAGTVAKPPAALRRDIDAAFQKNDFRFDRCIHRIWTRGGPQSGSGQLVRPWPHSRGPRAVARRPQRDACIT